MYYYVVTQRGRNNLKKTTKHKPLRNVTKELRRWFYRFTEAFFIEGHANMFCNPMIGFVPHMCRYKFRFQIPICRFLQMLDF